MFFIEYKICQKSFYSEIRDFSVVLMHLTEIEIRQKCDKDIYFVKYKNCHFYI